MRERERERESITIQIQWIVPKKKFDSFHNKSQTQKKSISFLPWNKKIWLDVGGAIFYWELKGKKELRSFNNSSSVPSWDGKGSLWIQYRF